MDQKHSDRVFSTAEEQDMGSRAICDAMYSCMTLNKDDAAMIPNVVLTVHTADCVPIILADIKTKTVAVIHAGWRGTLKGITSKTIRKMKESGAQAGDMVAVIGPSIGACCYGVSEDRARFFEEIYPSRTGVVTRENGPHIDLVRANYVSLRGEGVSDNRIDSFSECTSCRIEEFFSYRGDRKETYGEMMGFITL